MSFLDLTSVEESTCIPAGQYTVKSTWLEDKATKAGTGRYLSVTFTIQNGKYHGEKIFHNFNYQNPSAKAQQIGLSQIKEFLVSSGFNGTNLEHPNMLLDRTCKVNVVIESNIQYGDKPKITAFLPSTGIDPSEEIPF